MDRSLGGASLADGSIELMVHRRTMADDALVIERKGEIVRPTKGKLSSRSAWRMSTVFGSRWTITRKNEGRTIL